MAKTEKYILHKQDYNHNFNINYIEELNEQQLAVVEQGDGPCLVLAGAGSGKTRTLVYRVAYLLEKGINPSRVLLMTFTNKAAREMLTRVEMLLGKQPRGLWGGTFHSIANRMLRTHAKSIGYTANFGILDQDDVRKILPQVLKELNIAKESYIPKVRVINSIMSFAKNSQRSIREVIEDQYSYLLPEVIPIIERINDAYEKKKLDSNVMDFDDLLTNWLKLLENYSQYGNSIANMFDYILVDEFQDTNTVQAKLVHFLAGNHNNLLVVGDDAQSIYSFRAATVDNILSFQQYYPNAKLFKLEVNYRSSPEILTFANQSIRQNKYQYEKNLQAKNESCTKPILVPTRDAQQQAEVVCQRILELNDEGQSLNDAAVLFRSSFQIIELELELQRRGIPYVVRGGLRFFEQAHIKDVVAYLCLLHNFKDEISWRRVLGMYEGVGQATATRIWERVKEQESLVAMLTVMQAMPVRGKAMASLGRVARLFLKLLEMPIINIHDLIILILEQGYQVYVENTYDDAKDRIEDLHQLAIFSSNYKTLSEFLSDSSLSEGFKSEKAVVQTNASDDKLVLSTIHQAKGLEWETVFAIALAEGQFPHYKVMEKPKEMEEERRLFYVTVTRAKKNLYLLYPLISRSFATGDKINRPSIFLREVDDNLYDTWEISEMATLAETAFIASGDDNVDWEPDTSDNEGASIFDIIRGI